MRAPIHILSAIVAVALLSGCGNKGDLYLRDPAAPPPMTAQEQADAQAQAQREAEVAPPPEERRRRRRGRD